MRETLVRFLALGPSPDFPDRQAQTQHDREPL
jgi:hypothetical protein